ncbi:glycosyl transferase [soil metagenome]
MKDQRPIRLDHLRALGGRRGLFEHARYTRPRLEHGYCLDDNGRALVLVCRAESCHIPFPNTLRDRAFEYVMEASSPRVWRNRLSVDEVWETGASDDAVGRGMWGLGVAASWWPEEEGRERASGRLRHALGFQSRWWHPRAYALLGLTAAVRASDEPALTEAIARHARHLPRPQRETSWMWPEPRLRYDNARLPEALIASGAVLEDSGLVDDGLALLRWLVGKELGQWGFSFAPTGGRGPEDRQPAYDQQPLEAWAMADAAVRALETTGDAEWLGVARLAASWFLGANDQGLKIYDNESGGCFDGLTGDGVNLNQGAESTLSALGALLALRKPVGAP